VVDQASGTTDELIQVFTLIPDNQIAQSFTPSLSAVSFVQLQIGTFYYPENVAVTSGQLYFFEPVLLSPGSLDIGYKNPSSYLGGDAWNNGLQDTGDYWFREGIVVPEPGTVWFAWASAASSSAGCRRERSRRPRSPSSTAS
jgi:hypothetical protein